MRWLIHAECTAQQHTLRDWRYGIQKSTKTLYFSLAFNICWLLTPKAVAGVMFSTAFVCLSACFPHDIYLFIYLFVYKTVS